MTSTDVYNDDVESLVVKTIGDIKYSAIPELKQRVKDETARKCGVEANEAKSLLTGPLYTEAVRRDILMRKAAKKYPFEGVTQCDLTVDKEKIFTKWDSSGKGDHKWLSPSEVNAKTKDITLAHYYCYCDTFLRNANVDVLERKKKGWESIVKFNRELRLGTTESKDLEKVRSAPGSAARLEWHAAATVRAAPTTATSAVCAAPPNKEIQKVCGQNGKECDDSNPCDDDTECKAPWTPYARRPFAEGSANLSLEKIEKARKSLGMEMDFDSEKEAALVNGGLFAVDVFSTLATVQGAVWATTGVAGSTGLAALEAAQLVAGYARLFCSAPFQIKRSACDSYGTGCSCVRSALRSLDRFCTGRGFLRPTF